MRNCPHCGRRGETMETRVGNAHTTRRYRCALMHRWVSVEIAVPDEVASSRKGNLAERARQWLAQGATTNF